MVSHVGLTESEWEIPNLAAQAQIIVVCMYVAERTKRVTLNLLSV